MLRSLLLYPTMWYPFFRCHCTDQVAGIAVFSTMYLYPALRSRCASASSMRLAIPSCCAFGLTARFAPLALPFRLFSFRVCMPSNSPVASSCATNTALSTMYRWNNSIGISIAGVYSIASLHRKKAALRSSYSSSTDTSASLLVLMTISLCISTLCCYCLCRKAKVRSSYCVIL